MSTALTSYSVKSDIYDSIFTMQCSPSKSEAAYYFNEKKLFQNHCSAVFVILSQTSVTYFQQSTGFYEFYLRNVHA